MDGICVSFLRTHTHTHTLVCFFLAVHTFVWANMHLGPEFSLVLVQFWMKSKRTASTYWHFYSSAHTPQSTMGWATTPQTVPVYKINYCMWCTCWKVLAQPLSVFLPVRKWYLQDTRCDTDEPEVPAFSVSGHHQSQTISHWVQSVVSSKRPYLKPKHKCVTLQTFLCLYFYHSCKTSCYVVMVVCNQRWLMVVSHERCRTDFVDVQSTAILVRCACSTQTTLQPQ